ncbi:hypothetical protein EGW08_011695 [Elysia chlorotica]|uniref:ribonuclease III n=1 Tax=Elysia chlorotica TaxID=188477 RepID=A0A433TG59_ELYCH|nr:hypothetical protein EGW08_011695 [Elysia chlorotica]
MATSGGVVRKGSRYHRLENIPSNTFTPRTYQIQLLDAALQRNTLLCQGCPSNKLFLALMVAKEMSSSTRSSIKDGGKRTFYLTDSEEEADAVTSTLPHHTDLKVGSYPPPCIENREQEKENHEDTNGVNKSYSLWQKLVEDNNIIVCTGANFLAALKNSLVELKNINLLIFDDCHCSVVEGHPYPCIVSQVKQLAVERIPEPRILGVTAAIAGTDCSDPDQLKTTISSMEYAMHAKAQTSMLILTERYGCRPQQQVIRCDLDDTDPIGISEEQSQLRQTMEGLLLSDYQFFIDSREQLIKQTPRQVLEQCLTILSVLGPWCCSSLGEYFHMQMEKIVKQERCDIHKRCMRCVMTTLRMLTRTFEASFHPDYCVHEFLAYTTPKVRALVKSLRKFKPEVDFIIVSNSSDDPDGDDSVLSDLSDDGEDDDDDEDSISGSDADNPNKSSSKPVHIAVKRTADGVTERVTGVVEEEEKNLCGIVFVENRYIAFGLSKVIEEVCSWDEDLCFVKSCHITGQGLRGSGGSGGSTKQQRNLRACKRQEEALRKFRTQEVNLVIATPELEEGIDIPKCNLVVRFDPPKDYRSYTLSKGRARARDASFIILLDADTCEGFQSRLEVFKGIEQENDGDTEDDEEDQNVNGKGIDEEDMLPAYKTIPSYHNSPQVTMQGAIGLINRYCAKLPSDAFTHLTPHCRLERIATKYIAYLRLPINSPIKQELQGPAMRSKKLAKMAVALKMCEILHNKGELDDQLMPVGKEMFVYEEEEEWADEDDIGGQARPGTTKRKQYYTKKVANAMLDCQPKPDRKNFLYLISLTLTGPITEEQNTRGRLIYAPEDTKQTLGLLVDKPIPQMPNFPVYTRSGEVTASVDLLSSEVVLSDSEISRLLKFHHFVFSGVLHLEKDPMEFNPEQTDYACVVVPLNGKFLSLLDYSFEILRSDAAKRKKGPGKVNKIEEEKENKFEFRLEDFEDAVVMPSYRNMDQPQHFYVAEIRTDLNPLSPFPSPELYKTFQDYYTTKYGLQISCKDQPLLDVDHTSARLNLLTPRYMNPKGMALPTSSAETKRARRENLQQKQILVPELCDVHIFPASLWRKAVCLPAILYRTNCLLLAEELRQRVAIQTGIGQEVLPPGFRFPQLDFGFETNPEKLIESESSSSDNLRTGHCAKDPTKESKSSSSNKPDNSTNDTEKLVIDTWGKNDQSGKKDITVQNHVGGGNVDQSKNNEKNETTSIEKVSLLENKTIDKSHVLSTGAKVLKQEKLPSAEPQSRLEKTSQPATSGLLDQSKNFDIGVWNERKRYQSQANKVNTSESKDLSDTIFTSPCGRMSLDEDRDLSSFPGPSPCLLLQALTMSNANDFFSLERLETIGDSFLKYAITVYLYCCYPGIHEGKLSYLRSKQVSNYNLYRLGRRKCLAERMVATKFEPYENWLPPGFIINEDRRRGPVPKVLVVPPGPREEVGNSPSKGNACRQEWSENTGNLFQNKADEADQFDAELAWLQQSQEQDEREEAGTAVYQGGGGGGGSGTPSGKAGTGLVPYSLQQHHGLPDKSLADCVEALIGCYLTTCGRKAALLFMSWLGLKVLPKRIKADQIEDSAPPWMVSEQQFEELRCPPSPMFYHSEANQSRLEQLLEGFDGLEETIQYKFRDRSYLLQAFTHASYHYNTITDCYQRIEFLGDAILDYVITRHLYEDSQKHSPGILTDLRSALVNNNIFAALAVKWGFHKYFKAVSPALFQVIDTFVKFQEGKDQDHIDIDEEVKEGVEEDDEDDEEEVEMEIPKALGDIFESVAGAIYLDSGMSLDAVWKVYYRMMKPHIDKYLKSIPKSPVRELLETEPETAKFERPQRTVNGKVRVTVNVVGKGEFSGIGRNYRIAKSAAAKRALRSIRYLNQNLS